MGARAAVLGVLAAFVSAAGCAAFAGVGSSSNDTPGDGGGMASDGAADGAVPTQADAAAPSDAAADDASADGATDPPTLIVTDDKCNLAKPFQKPVLVEGLVPGAYDTLGGFLTADFQLYFGSTRNSGGSDDHIYSATGVPDAGTLTFANIAAVSALNSTSFDSSPSLTIDGLQLFFESDRDPIVPGAAGRNIWVATRINALSSWGPPTLAGGLNTNFTDEQPFVTISGTGIYFASNRGTDGGTMDLYQATGAMGAFGNATALDPVNGTSDDFHPVVTSDQLTLYFASNRPGVGDYDVYVSTRTTTASDFGPPTIVMELSTTNKDEPTWVSLGGCTMLLASNRPVKGLPANVNLFITSKPPK
jgi:hypothetical protein